MHHHKKNSRLNKPLFFFVPHFLIFTRSLPCVRRGYHIHPTASFSYSPQATFRFISAVGCLQPLIVWAVAPSLSHRGRRRYHFALNQSTPKAVLYCFPAVLRSHHYAPLRKLRCALILRWLFDCRNPATALLEKATFATASVPFLRCLGVFIAPLVS